MWLSLKRSLVRVVTKHSSVGKSLKLFLLKSISRSRFKNLISLGRYCSKLFEMSTSSSWTYTQTCSSNEQCNPQTSVTYLRKMTQGCRKFDEAILPQYNFSQRCQGYDVFGQSVQFIFTQIYHMDSHQGAHSSGQIFQVGVADIYLQRKINISTS